MCLVESVIDGRSDFNGLHSRRTIRKCSSTPSTSWPIDDEDLRQLPLEMRKANLSRLLRAASDGHACLMGLEGMVSKHRESLYRGGRFRHWIKVKNRQPPAFSRVLDQFG